MNDPLRCFSVVLLGRYPGKDLAVAQALTALLGREETWGLRVVSASPIILFEKLSRQEAAYLLNVLSAVAEAGCRFDVQEGSNSTYPKVGWSVPAKFNGVPLAEVCAEAAAMPPLPVTVNTQSQTDAPSTPLRGTAKIPLPNLAFNNAQQPTPTHAQIPVQPSHTYATLYLPCPYTGQTMKLTLDVTVSRVENAGTVSIAAQAQPALAPVAARSSKSGTIVLPTARRQSVSGAIATANLETAHAPLASGVSSTVAPTVTRPHSSSHSLPAPSWKRKTPPDGLPDVPVLPSTSLSRDGTPSADEVSHMPSGGQPMDLSDFEQSLGMAPSHDRPLIDAGASNIFGDPTSSGELNAMLSTGAGKETLCSIFIERSSSPVVHELVAELHGIPEPEAAQMCVSGRTALAENIPLEEAVEIKRRCAEINVMARIITHQ